MKHFFALAFLFALISCGGNNSTPTPAPAAPLEVVKTAVGTLIGPPVTQAIGASGGSATVISAGAKIIVPAGALPDGSSVTVQAISNTLLGSGEGVQISGDAWTKPVTMQFSYPVGETDPNNFRIAIQQNDGSWITSKSAKVDTVNRTVSVRLGPDSSASIGGGALRSTGLKPTAKLNRRNIVMTKAFYLKPGSVTVKLGGTAIFTAYASVAVTEAAPSSQATSDDDELVPLVQPVVSSKKPIDDDELTPLTRLRVVVREYPFTNAKAGFTRLWSVEGPGKIEASGASNGLYTAPSDPGARGKTAKVFFTSFDAKGAVVISGSVKIEGVQAYQVMGQDRGATLSGIICDSDKPFALDFVSTDGVSIPFQFTPSSAVAGSFQASWTATQISGSYMITDPDKNGNGGSLRTVGTMLVSAPPIVESFPVDSLWALTKIPTCTP
jgi:hypothetical protein